MAVGFLRLTLSRAVMVHRGCKSLGSLLLCKNPRSTLPMLSHLGSTLYQLVWLSTATSDSSGPEETEPPEKKKKKKKQDPKSRTTIGSVGRKIHHHHLLLLDEHGVNMGIMHRADALRLMDEKGLKLVQVNEYAEPPVFRLMSGKQIHEEQMRLREKQKAKISGPVQVKDLTLSADIALHDLDTKLKLVSQWLEKKHHVRLTVKGRHGESALDSTLDEMVVGLTVPFGFISKPKLTHEGRAASCILRPPSTKELQQQVAKNREEKTAAVSEPGTGTDSQQH